MDIKQELEEEDYELIQGEEDFSFLEVEDDAFEPADFDKLLRAFQMEMAV